MTGVFQVTTLAWLALAGAMPAWGQGQHAPKYSAKVPPYITTPDTVQTRIGALKFFDGFPDAETVQKVYDNLDFGRGVDAFLSGMPAASLFAACEGLSEAGVKRNGGIGITEELMYASPEAPTSSSMTTGIPGPSRVTATRAPYRAMRGFRVGGVIASPAA